MQKINTVARRVTCVKWIITMPDPISYPANLVHYQISSPTKYN